MSKLSAGTSQDPFVAYADCILDGGTLAWRNNNPGNLLPGKLPYKNAIGIDKRGLAIFPDYNSGWTALHDVLRSNLYGALSITDAMKKYAPASDPHNDPVAYAATIHQLTGLDTTRLVKSLNDAELEKMMGAIKQVEGFTVGTVHHATDPNLTPQLKDLFGVPANANSAGTPTASPNTSGDSATTSKSVDTTNSANTSNTSDNSETSDAADNTDTSVTSDATDTSSDTSDTSDTSSDTPDTSSDTSDTSDTSSDNSGTSDTSDGTDPPTDTTDTSDTSADTTDTSDTSDTSADTTDTTGTSDTSDTSEPAFAGADS